ncbi:MAG: dipeptidyl-peptidase-4, partial [Mariniblastus sp.]
MRMPLAILFVFLAGQYGLAGTQAQQTTDSWSAETTETRLKAVYERGEFQAKGFAAKWWTNSSGYTVRKREPKTQKLVSVHYDVRTGKQIEAKPSDQTKPDSRRLVSPDGKLQLEFRSRNLFVLELESGKRTQLTNRDPDRDVWF